MFVVESNSSLERTLIQSKDVHLDSVTYYWPWLNIGVRKSTPTNLTDRPCDLLIIKAYANHTGNWRLVIQKGNSEDDGVKVFLGTKAKLPNFSIVKIKALIIREAHITKIREQKRVWVSERIRTQTSRTIQTENKVVSIALLSSSLHITQLRKHRWPSKSRGKYTELLYYYAKICVSSGTG